jgi:hypothetical protein
MSFNPKDYGPIFAPLLAKGSVQSLVGLSFESAFAHARIVDRDMAQCCLAGIWLLHDCLDESHTISQGIETPSGSFWHAIMHRREGDFSNAKYWFRRVGQHAVFAPLAKRAAELAVNLGASSSKFTDGDEWDPFAFVDVCQQAARDGQGADLCRAVQQAEWELLFDSCYRAGVS